MKILRDSLVLWFVGILANFQNVNNVRCEKSASTLELTILALYRDVKFLYERPEEMDVDAIFGINFAQVHVAAVLEHDENAIILGEKNRRMLEEVLSFCKIAKNDGKHILRASGLERMIRPEIWNRTILWRRDELLEKSSRRNRLRMIENAYPINRGTPSELETLSCFLDLLLQDQQSVCTVSEKCGQILVRNDSPRGYPLTHRLLYVQLATALGCKENSRVPFARMKRDFCSAIFHHLTDLESLNFPSFSQDLAMEQIALCGMEGYLEFTDEHFATLITSWANSHGCFSAFGFDKNERKMRSKRSTSLMEYGCDSHASGVAAACLSLLVRSLVENSM